MMVSTDFKKPPNNTMQWTALMLNRRLGEYDHDKSVCPPEGSTGKHSFTGSGYDLGRPVAFVTSGFRRLQESRRSSEKAAAFPAFPSGSEEPPAKGAEGAVAFSTRPWGWVGLML